MADGASQRYAVVSASPHFAMFLFAPDGIITHHVKWVYF